MILPIASGDTPSEAYAGLKSRFRIRALPEIRLPLELPNNCNMLGTPLLEGTEGPTDRIRRGTINEDTVTAVGLRFVTAGIGSDEIVDNIVIARRRRSFRK